MQHQDLPQEIQDIIQLFSQTDLLEKAVEEGDLVLLKRIHRSGYYFSAGEYGITDAGSRAAMCGHLEMVKWLHENNISKCAVHAIDDASSGGHLEVVKYIHSYGENSGKRCISCIRDAMNCAIICGHLDIVKFLHQHGTSYSPHSMDTAAREGYFEIVKFLHENRTEGCTKDAMDNAASKGHLEIVKFLHENRTEGCTNRAMRDAAANGHFEVVKFLMENCPLGIHGARAAAAKNNHVEILNYLNIPRIRRQN